VALVPSHPQYREGAWLPRKSRSWQVSLPFEIGSAKSVVAAQRDLRRYVIRTGVDGSKPGTGPAG